VVYGGNASPDGLPSLVYSVRTPTAPLVRIIGADNIRFEGGLYGRGFSVFPPPVFGDLRDMPAFEWIPAIRPDKTAISSSIGGGLFGVAITNMPVSVQVAAVDFGFEVHGFSGLKFRDLIIENFSTVFKLGVGNTAGKVGWSASQNLELSGCQIGGASAWYGGQEKSSQLLTDKIHGGKFDFPFCAFDGDLRFGPNTTGSVCRVGVNPWGGNPQGVDESGKNSFKYLWKP
jgi:hypothetical protein